MNARLGVVSGPYQGSSFDVLGVEAVIGRNTGDIQLVNDGSVSRKHAIIRTFNDRFFLQDCGSTNGTFLNGKLVVEAELHEGDTICLGSSTMIFQIDIPSAQSQAYRTISLGTRQSPVQSYDQPALSQIYTAAPPTLGAAPKDKTAAILIAIFLSFYGWLYTYHRDSVKFWSALVVSMLFGAVGGACASLHVALGQILANIVGVAVWLYAIIDIAIRPDSFYRGYLDPRPLPTWYSTANIPLLPEDHLLCALSVLNIFAGMALGIYGRTRDDVAWQNTGKRCLMWALASTAVAFVMVLLVFALVGAMFYASPGGH